MEGNCFVCGTECFGISFDEDDIFLLKDSVEQVIYMNDIKEQLSRRIQEKLSKRMHSSSGMHRTATSALTDNLPTLVCSLNDIRVRIAERRINLESKRELLKGLCKRRNSLVETVSIHNRLKEAISREAGYVESMLPYLRWKTALRILNMCELQLSVNSSSFVNDREQKRPRAVDISGCSSIFGLPIPNGMSGLQMQSDIPEGVLVAVLSHITHLIDSLSAVLNIPTRVELKPFGMFECAMVSSRSEKSRFLPLMSNLAVRAMDHGDEHWTLKKPNRLNSEFLNEHFSAAVSNLQKTIIGFCLSMGIDPQFLWPKEAMLLNIGEIMKHCEKKCAEVEASRLFTFTSNSKRNSIFDSISNDDLPCFRDIAHRYIAVHAMSQNSHTSSTFDLDDDFYSTLTDATQKGADKSGSSRRISFDLTKWTEELCSDWDLL